jgi:hypothetical protein
VKNFNRLVAAREDKAGRYNGSWPRCPPPSDAHGFYIEATGSPKGVAQGLQLIRKLGRFAEFSGVRGPFMHRFGDIPVPSGGQEERRPHPAVAQIGRN